MQDTRSCREWKPAPGYMGYNKVPCAACETWKEEKCSDIVAVVKRYEDTPNYAEYNRMMREAKDIQL